jgi:outer membrane protein assembly factor BamE (lipoprotein component of BamABCDE complex)
MPAYPIQSGDGLWGASWLRIKPAKRCLIAQALVLAGCAAQPFTFTESEQHLIGHAQSQVAECLGSPNHTRDDGYTSIWTYEFAQSAGGVSQACSLIVTFKQKYVSNVTSTDASGNRLPPGQQCWTATMGWCSTIK